MPNTKAAGFPTKSATHSSSSSCNVVVPVGNIETVETQYLTGNKNDAEKDFIPPSTRALQVLGENLFSDSIARGVQYSSAAAKPR